jgi:hypothetical protein
MYWTIVFAVVALMCAPFALVAAAPTASAALWVGMVFGTLAVLAAAGALIGRLR